MITVTVPVIGDAFATGIRALHGSILAAVGMTGPENQNLVPL
jgi:hypothetical protein